MVHLWIAASQKINIPSTVNELPNNIFSGCEKIEQITLPKKLKKIGAYAFYKCKRLKQITIPKIGRAHV